MLVGKEKSLIFCISINFLVLSVLIKLRVYFFFWLCRNMEFFCITLYFWIWLVKWRLSRKVIVWEIIKIWSSKFRSFLKVNICVLIWEIISYPIFSSWFIVISSLVFLVLEYIRRDGMRLKFRWATLLFSILFFHKLIIPSLSGYLLFFSLPTKPKQSLSYQFALFIQKVGQA